MSLPQETMIELMALADGELEGDARDRVEKLLAENEEARRVVESMRSPAIGLWLRSTMETRVDAMSDVAEAVMARLDAPRRSEGVARLAERRARGPARVQLFAAGTVAALAIAAGVAVYMRPGERAEQPVASAPQPSADTSAEPTPSSAVAAQGARPAQGVEVDEIDSPSNNVSVFEIPVGSARAMAKQPTVVIWIEDEPQGKQ